MYNQVSNMYKNYNSKTSSPSYIIEDLLRQKYLVNTNNSAPQRVGKFCSSEGKEKIIFPLAVVVVVHSLAAQRTVCYQFQEKTC